MHDQYGVLMVQMLLFSVDEVRGAVPLAVTSYVIRMVGLHKPSNTQPGNAGTINFHGKSIPVISVKRLFGRPESPPSLTDMLIIVRAGEDDIALWVDSTSGVQDLATELSGDLHNAIPGTASLADGIILISDLPAFINSRKTLTDSSASQMAVVETHDHGPQFSVGQGSPDRDQVISLLAERARKIAQPEQGLADTQTTEVLRFRLAYREYAIEMKYIREVILTGEITPVPGTPDYISGICVVRGEIISLIDLRVLLSISERGLTDLNRVIVLTDQSLTFGILADHITGIGTLELIRVVPPDPDNASAGNRYVKGIADQSLIVLDTAAFFSDPRMIIDES